MKDYLLSEIKEYCKQRCVKFAKPYKNETKLLSPCKKCEMLETICKETLPVGWDIEPRDMIELPYKQEIKFSGECSEWQIVWRDDFIQRIRFADFPTEAEADEFLRGLKEDKQ